MQNDVATGAGLMGCGCLTILLNLGLLAAGVVIVVEVLRALRVIPA